MRKSTYAPAMRQSNPIRRRVLAAALVAGVLALSTAVAAGSIGHGHRRAACMRGTACGFTLDGQIKGLYPGVHKRLKIVVHNRGSRRLTVRSITTRVRGGSAACRARNLRVSRYRGRLRIRAYTSRRVRVRIWMRRSTPTACQGHVFRLTFRGRGTQ